MILVHHLNNSRSQRILWLMEELGLDYEIRHYQRDPETLRAPPELRAVHPLGKSPVISDGDQVFAESGVIIEYLVERHGQGRLAPSADSPAYWRYRYWMHYAEGSAMLPLLMKLVFDRVEKAPAPWLFRPVVRGVATQVKRNFVLPEIQLHLDYIESELARNPWFAGEEFSAADIQMSFPLEAAAARAGLDARRPKTMALIERMHARPAYRRALERGGKFQLA